MADTFYEVKLVAAPWTNWNLMWVLQRQGTGAYEYTTDSYGDTHPLVFESLRAAERWVRDEKPTWWIVMPPSLIVGNPQIPEHMKP